MKAESYKTARIFSRMEQATKRDRMILAGGKFGKGKQIYTCYYWPESFDSESQSIQYCKQAAKREGIERLFIETDASDAEYFYQEGWYFDVED
ncbi:MAG: hypothetical protein GY757_52900 [bacterium]|nr:hypothetical protein [bacterium]